MRLLFLSFLLIFLLLSLRTVLLNFRYEYVSRNCSNVPENDRIDCIPEPHATYKECLRRGCCWSPNSLNKSAPTCYFPKNYGIYRAEEVVETDSGIDVSLRIVDGRYPANLIRRPIVQVRYIRDDQVRIKISDSREDRYQVPLTLNSRVEFDNVNYKVHVEAFPFALVVTRKHPESVIFDSRVAPLVFGDQFLSISTGVNGSHIHGIGERWGESGVPLEWNSYPLFNADHNPRSGTNGYGTHPFFLVSGQFGSYGVLFMNSNAQEFVTQPSQRITWRSIGGIFDIFLFTGPTPLQVVKQYADLVGRSLLPPYWALGFHVSKYGYRSTQDVRSIVRRLRAAGIPQDVQWADIDYMDRHRQFTFSWDGFGDLGALVDLLHEDHLYAVLINEPHVSMTNPDYLPYRDGVDANCFVRDGTNKSFATARSWPGMCHYVDFGSSNSSAYWTKQMRRFHGFVKFDGIWIDMNDPSSFSDSCPPGKYNNPPYVPRKLAFDHLYSRTLCMDSIHQRGLHYNVHSVYSTLESIDTFAALKSVRPGRRPFIISRSSFVSQGSSSGTWSGDTFSTYQNLKNSISSMVRMNLFGISLTGTDICGFAGEATEDLCTRWYLVGAFYPFMRNHADHSDKTPLAFGGTMASAVRRIVLERYKLLPFLYSLFYRSNAFGEPVVQPLFMGWSGDWNTYSIERQFTWGSVLLVTPAFESDHVDGYFPAGVWYDYWHANPPIRSNGTFVQFYTPVDKINVHVLGGNIIPIQRPALRTRYSRENSFGVYAYASGAGCGGVIARGELFWDDGISDSPGNHNLINFTLSCWAGRYELSSVGHISYRARMVLGDVEVNGVPRPRESVLANNISLPYDYESQLELLRLRIPDLSMLDPIVVSWK